MGLTVALTVGLVVGVGVFTAGIVVVALTVGLIVGVGIFVAGMTVVVLLLRVLLLLAVLLPVLLPAALVPSPELALQERLMLALAKALLMMQVVKAPRGPASTSQPAG